MRKIKFMILVWQPGRFPQFVPQSKLGASVGGFSTTAGKIDDSLVARADDMVQAFESGSLLLALTIALTLLDICGKRLYPDKHSGERYAKWFDKYISPDYIDSPQYPPKADEDYYFNGTEYYRLGCVFLHEGINALDTSRKTLLNYNIVQFHLFDSSKEGVLLSTLVTGSPLIKTISDSSTTR